MKPQWHVSANRRLPSVVNSGLPTQEHPPSSRAPTLAPEKIPFRRPEHSVPSFARCHLQQTQTRAVPRAVARDSRKPRYLDGSSPALEEPTGRRQACLARLPICPPEQTGTLLLFLLLFSHSICLFITWSIPLCRCIHWYRSLNMWLTI